MSRFFETYFGYPEANPGEGTSWSLKLVPPWPTDWPPWLGVAMWVLVILVVGGIVIRSTRQLSRSRRIVLLSLRWLAVGLLMWLLGESTLAVERTGLPTVMVLVDTSRSMTIRDQYADREDQQLVQQLMRPLSSGRNPRPPQRWEIVRELMTREDGEFLQELLRHRRLRIYEFSDRLNALGAPEVRSQADLQQTLQHMAELEPSGRTTRPADVLTQILDETRGTPPLAIVILTDGVQTPADAAPITAAIPAAVAQRVPMFPVILGPSKPPPDAAVVGVLVDEVALAGTPLSIHGQIHLTGVKAERIRVILEDAHSHQLLAQSFVSWGSRSVVEPFELVYAPQQPGEYDYRISLSAIEGESNLENNSVVRHVSVREGQLRILLADWQPRFEFRNLKALLEKRQSQSGTIELHTVLQQGDLGYARQDRSAAALAGQFPITLDQLLEYDLIILGDLNRQLIPDEALSALRAFVSESGGSLIVIAGANHMPHDYAGSPLAEVLPVIVDSSPSFEGPSGAAGFETRFTVEALRGTTLLHGLVEGAEQGTGWPAEPPLHWRHPASKLKPGAVALAQAPSRVDAQQMQPLIAMHNVGRGKVVYHGTDETWRWRDLSNDQHFGPYWLQLIRYLSRSRMLGRDRSAELSTDRLIYEVGEPVRFRLRYLDEVPVFEGEPEVTVRIESRGAVTRQVKLRPSATLGGVFEGQLEHAESGQFHAWVAAPEFSDTPPASDYRVEQTDVELSEQTANHAGLSLLARRTGGQLHSISSLSELPASLPDGVPLPLEPLPPRSLWDRWESLLLFVCVVVAEWVLRYRWRMNAAM